MAGIITPDLGTLISAARTADPWRKIGGSIPKKTPDPAGTGSFMRIVHNFFHTIDLFTDQCQVSPFLYVEASITAAIRAFFTILEPDPKEIYHQLAGQSLVCSLKSEIRAASEFSHRYENGLGKFLFTTSEVVDMSVWYLFLASVLVDGLVDTGTLAQQMAGCSGSKLPYSGSSAYGAIPDSESLDKGNGFDWNINAPQGPVMAATTLINPGETGYLIWTAQAGISAEEQVPIISYFEDVNSGARTDAQMSQPDEKNPGKWHHNIMKLRRQPPPSGRPEVWVVRAKAAIPCPNHEAGFISGFCASSNPFN